MMEDWDDSVEKAYDCIRQHLKPTPLVFSSELSKRYGCRVLLKMENLQPTGSFKIRGALNKCRKVLEDKEAKDFTFVAASTGNHALACCFAWRTFGCRGELIVPSTISATKEEKIRSKGFKLIKDGAQPGDAETTARKFAEDNPGYVFISPYNDTAVMAGQATTAVELLSQADAAGESIDAVIVSVGGGGLIGGIAKVLASRTPHVLVIGGQAERNCHMVRCIEAGTLVEPTDDCLQPTLAEGLAGSVEKNSVTMEPCLGCVHTWSAVSEAEIASATLEIEETEGVRVEAAAGVVLAVMRRRKEMLREKTVVLVMCGGNVGEEEWQEYQKVAAQATL